MLRAVLVGVVVSMAVAVPVAAAGPPGASPTPTSGAGSSQPQTNPAIAASCVNISLQQALAATTNVAFVGTTSSITDGGLTAQVRVESVWQGSNPFPVSVVVVGGDPAHPFPYSRRFTNATRYLFVEPAGVSPFHDNGCSATRVYTASLDVYRPAGAHPPLPLVPTADTGVAVGRFLPWLGVLGLVVALTALLALRDRRDNRPPLP